MVKLEIGGHSLLNTNGKTNGKTNGDENGSAGRKVSIGQKYKRDKPTHFNWGSSQPRLVIAADTEEFDEEIIHHFQEEGYQIWYLYYSGDKAAYHDQLQRLADPLERGETYAIVAYGDAAALCLEACEQAMPKLCAMVAYYPTYIPHASEKTPPFQLQIHLASSQKFGTRHPSFRYESTSPGFAESDMEEYSTLAASLAWSRTLGAIRTGFGISVDLEAIWDNHTALEFEKQDAAATMETMVPEPYVNHIPTMTGGIGHDELFRFYRDYFVVGNPPSLKITLLSRTCGTDRIVDEMLVTFRHTCEIPWMLPGVPATDKEVEVILVSVVCIRGEKLYHEHIHWDQATVLVQIGLLDPLLIPKGFRTAEEGREKDVKRLPVVGREGARKAVDKDDGKSNQLIPQWS